MDTQKAPVVSTRGHRKTRFARLPRSRSLYSRDPRCARRSLRSLPCLLRPPSSTRPPLSVPPVTCWATGRAGLKGAALSRAFSRLGGHYPRGSGATERICRRATATGPGLSGCFRRWFSLLQSEFSGRWQQSQSCQRQRDRNRASTSLLAIRRRRRRPRLRRATRWPSPRWLRRRGTGIRPWR